MSASVCEGPGFIEVVVRPPRWQLAMSVVNVGFFSLAAGLLTWSLVKFGRPGHVRWEVYMWLALAVCFALVSVYTLTQRELLRVAPGVVRHSALALGVRLRLREVETGSAVFVLQPRRSLLSLRESAPLLRLADSDLVVGAGQLTAREIDDLVGRLNGFLEPASLTSASS